MPIMPAMTKPALWRVLIFLGTLFCVVMLFAPLISEMMRRLAQPTGSGFP